MVLDTTEMATVKKRYGYHINKTPNIRSKILLSQFVK